MNATFPYITPIVSLPSEPVMDIMDAGIRDNYGLSTSLKYLYTFRNWISSNTSGVIIIQIRDGHKSFPIDENPQRSLFQILTSPLGNVYSNLTNMQVFEQDQLIQYASTWYEGKIDVIDLQLRNDEKDKISMSLHLTTREKKKLKASINLVENQNAIKRLKKLLE